MASAPGDRARPSSRSTAGGWSAACTGWRPTCARSTGTRAHPAPLAGPGPPPGGGPGGLHQRRQVDPAQPPHRCRCPGGGPALRHPRPPHPPAGPARRRDGAGHRHRRGSSASCPTSWWRRSAPPSTRCAWPTWWCTWSTGRPPTPRARSTRCARCWPRSAPTDVPELLVVNKADRSPEAAEAWRLPDPRRRGGRLGPHRRGHRRAAAGRGRPPAGGRPGGGAGRSPGPGATCWPPCTARARWWTSRHGDEAATVHVVLDEAGRARFAEFVAGRLRDGPTSPASGPPRTPTTGWRALRPAGRARCPGGLVDCSVGTPCDPPPPAVVRALASSGTERGYPASAGQPGAAAGRGRLAASAGSGSTWTPAPWRPASGTKELVASTPHYLRLRDPERDTVLYPAVVVPDLRHGGDAGRLPGRGGAAPAEADGAGSTSTPIAADDAERAVLLWVNSPSNPTGGLTDLGGGRRLGTGATACPVFSDECYTEFTWDGPPRSILQHGTRRGGGRALAVQALEPGRGAGRLLRRRPRAGGLPARRAPARRAHGPRAGAGGGGGGPGRRRPRGRAAASATASGSSSWPHVLGAAGCPVEPARPAASTCGCRCPTPVGRRLGHGRRPGRGRRDAGQPRRPLRGPAGAGYVRMAVVQPMERLRLVAERLEAAGWRAA